jgi:hypothetical protein
MANLLEGGWVTGLKYADEVQVHVTSQHMQTALVHPLFVVV